LRANPSYSVLIAGNCDDRGTEEYNLALGERRAMSAKKFLVALGISPDRLKTISYGELRPADPANNPVAWALESKRHIQTVSIVPGFSTIDLSARQQLFIITSGVASSSFCAAPVFVQNLFCRFS
jgi:hypothetical protein